VLNITLESEYAGPRAGTFVWEGELRNISANGTLVSIENGKASVGSVSGDLLPGVPCAIHLSSSQNVTIVNAPGPGNQYQRVILRINSRGRVKASLRWELLPD